MCGISGFIDFKHGSQKEVLISMTDILRHRGPDAGGYHFEQFPDYSIGLGHRRLAILDLSDAGHQPMKYLNDRYIIVFNGEIYNFNEIRDSLIQLGHSFKSKSDTEVILHAYGEWGEACLDKFTGMFAFVIYDKERQEVFCARDRSGVKPLFYFWDGSVFIFASELKSILKHPQFTKKIERKSIQLYLQHGYIPAPHTIFQSVYKLIPGCFLRLNITEKQYNIKEYWNVYDHYNKPILNVSLPEAVEETERILRKAFAYRMIADVPVGVFLSGGYDSSCLVSLLQSQSSNRIKTFTIGMQDARLDEAIYAKDIAAIVGTDHHEYYITEKDALDIVPQLPFYYDEPFADSSAIPTILVSKMAKSSVTVALSADGGDEIFGGYDRYNWLCENYRRFNAFPSPLRKSFSALMAMADKLMPFSKLMNPVLLKKADKLKDFLSHPDAMTIYKGMLINYTDRERQLVLGADDTVPASAHDFEGLYNEYFDPLRYAMAKEYQSYMVDDVLQKVDRATMSVSLEGREPFLDQSIIEWAAQLPSSYKIRNGDTKYILKQIVHKYIPKKVMDRPKMGFSIPLNAWLHNSLKPLVTEYLSEQNVKKQGIFNFSYVNEIVSNFYLRHNENDYKLWYLLMFQMWYEKWMSESTEI